MTVELQVALNFLISFLYNKLPRRRVNNFGEELEAALKVKFEGHWYPDKPCKGSAYRCLKTTPPLDPVFEIAARESGMALSDIQENLPSELSIWIDPGEVSYRMSEKGPVKILYSQEDRIIDADQPPREVISTFNPEAQSFKPLDTMACNFSNLSLTPSNGVKVNPMVQPSMTGPYSQSMTSFKTPVSTAPISSFGSKVNGNNNVTLTAGMFAQTKFGSTKLKTNGKRNQRMSPTEFGNYIKQKALIQEQNMNPGYHSGGHRGQGFGNNSPQNSRSISPEGMDSPLLDFGNTNHLLMSPQTPSPPSNFSPFGMNGYGNGSLFDSGLDLFGSSGRTSYGFGESLSPMSNRFSSFLDKASPFVGSPASSGSLLGSSPDSGVNTAMTGEECSQSLSSSASSNDTNAAATSPSSSANNSKTNFENLTGVCYPNQYQHLLLAN